MLSVKTTHIYSALSVVCASVMLAPVARAVPVVPNFQQGQMTSHTETTSEVVETIHSYDYNSGYTYSVQGHGVKPSDNGTIIPSNIDQTSQTINGVSSTWTGLDLSGGTKPSWVQTNPGGSFSMMENYRAPGLQNHTIIQRTTTIQSVTDPTSIFTQ